MKFFYIALLLLVQTACLLANDGVLSSEGKRFVMGNLSREVENAGNQEFIFVLDTETGRIWELDADGKDTYVLHRVMYETPGEGKKAEKTDVPPALQTGTR